MLGETPQTIQAWLASLAPVPHPEASITRMWEELEELAELPADDPRRIVEAADVAICLISNPAIWKAIEAKMAINRARTWRVDERGHIYHVPNEVPDAGE